TPAREPGALRSPAPAASPQDSPGGRAIPHTGTPSAASVAPVNAGPPSRPRTRAPPQPPCRPPDRQQRRPLDATLEQLDAARGEAPLVIGVSLAEVDRVDAQPGRRACQL